ncbi:MAG TPA: polysaccharide pyruvyl transferase family protein, partial [Roseiflexaceae bacterium]|nr:polysaccharide pyruvyl transferase family protein [Roseiflexaceae bacterium]
HAGLAAIRRAFTVGVTALNWAGQNHTFTAQERYEQALAEAIDAIAARGGAVVLFAQCCGPSAVEDDRPVARRIYAMLRCKERVLLLDRPLPPRLLQAAYGQMDSFIGTRMHSVILALNAGVPALAVGYLHKTAGMLAALGLAHRALDIGAVSGAQLLQAFERLQREAGQTGAEAALARARRVKAALPALLRGAAQRGGSGEARPSPKPTPREREGQTPRNRPIHPAREER